MSMCRMLWDILQTRYTIYNRLCDRISLPCISSPSLKRTPSTQASINPRNRANPVPTAYPGFTDPPQPVGSKFNLPFPPFRCTCMLRTRFMGVPGRCGFSSILRGPESNRPFWLMRPANHHYSTPRYFHLSCLPIFALARCCDSCPGRMGRL